MSLDDGFNPQRLSLDAMLSQESVQRRAANFQFLGYPAEIAPVNCKDMQDEVCLKPVPGLFKGYGRWGLLIVG